MEKAEEHQTPIGEPDDQRVGGSALKPEGLCALCTLYESCLELNKCLISGEKLEHD